MSTPADSSTSRRKRSFGRRERIIVLTLVVAFLFALLFVQQAFDTLPFLSPGSASETLILFALSTLNLIAFVVLLMVLVRNIIKLRRERREMKLGARFKVRLVIYSIALSLLPALWLFFMTAGLINRSVDKWFSHPTRIMISEAREIQEAYVAGEENGLQRDAITLARLVAHTADDRLSQTLADELSNQRLSALYLYDQTGRLLFQQSAPDVAPVQSLGEALQRIRFRARSQGPVTERIEEDKTRIWLLAAAPVTMPDLMTRTLVLAQLVPPELAERATRINQQSAEYDKLKQKQQALKRTTILVLALMTIFALFVATWMALHAARTIADPLKQLLQAIEQIRSGNLSTRAEVIGDDEFASLAMSFNDMTAELESSNDALSERRRYIETVLQSLSAGVISLDENNRVTTINEAAFRLLHLEPASVSNLSGEALETLLPETQRDELWRMIRRAARMNSVTREVHFKLANNVQLDAAVTVTALLDPRGKWRGTVIVLEDLSDLIEAQRRAAWSEVARRMAHEIKNPLTPIRLSAERLAKNLLAQVSGQSSGNGNHHLTERETKLVRECTGIIGDEVATLQRMVDEFSTFARMPNAKLEPGSLNEVVTSALKLYADRLNGVALKSHLAPALPAVLIDSEQIKRALVNLIDNAIEAMADSAGEQCVTIETREAAEREAVELIIADTGPGIAPADRERVFDPYFSTRNRGTGLGLAIVSRTVAEHHGRIRVQENQPRGARFVIELPRVTESDAATQRHSDTEKSA
jgi:nitrogen fixation/metabolism regulation signal transduction histidine kinase